MTCVHNTIRVKVWADVDELIAPLVAKLNSFDGVTTHASCQGTIGQGGAEPYGAYVMASWRKDMEPFLLRNFSVELLGKCWGKISEAATPASTGEANGPAYWQCPNNEAHHLRFGEKIYGTQAYRQYCIHCPDTEAIFRSKPPAPTSVPQAEPPKAEIYGSTACQCTHSWGDHGVTNGGPKPCSLCGCKDYAASGINK